MGFSKYGLFVILVVSLGVFMFGFENADALKSDGKSLPKFGELTKNLVCGDKLCKAPDKTSNEISNGDSDGIWDTATTLNGYPATYESIAAIVDGFMPRPLYPFPDLSPEGNVELKLFELKCPTNLEHLLKKNRYNIIIGTNERDELVGTDYNDMIFAKGGDDIILGKGGNDLIFGGDGTDYIFGGDGNDVVCAGMGNDFVNGQAGNDYLYGEEGEDKLYGYTGNDYVQEGTSSPSTQYGFVDGGAGYDRCVGDPTNDCEIVH